MGETNQAALLHTVNSLHCAVYCKMQCSTVQCAVKCSAVQYSGVYSQVGSLCNVSCRFTSEEWLSAVPPCPMAVQLPEIETAERDRFAETKTPQKDCFQEGDTRVSTATGTLQSQGSLGKCPLKALQIMLHCTRRDLLIFHYCC